MRIQRRVACSTPHPTGRTTNKERATVTSETPHTPKPERNPTKGLLYILLGLVIVAAGFGLVLTIRYGSAFGVERPELMGAVIYMGLGLFVGWLGFRTIMRGHKLRMVDGDQLIEQSDKKPFLYLRSFALDQEDGENTFPIYAGVSAPINPYESGIAAGFRGAGPLVAIGRPGEKFATLGASRVYFDDDHWQEKVAQLASNAALIIWVYGKTEGLKWEISELVGDVDPKKLVVALPYWDVPPKKRGPLGEDVVATIGPVLPKPLPQTIGDSLFIVFDDDWTPIPVKARPPHILIRTMAFGAWSRVTQGIRTVLDLRGIPYPKPSTSFLVFAAFLSVFWLYILAIFVVLIYGGFIRLFWEIEALEKFARMVFWFI